MNAWLWCLLLVVQQIQANEVSPQEDDYPTNLLPLDPAESVRPHDSIPRKSAGWSGQANTYEPYENEEIGLSDPGLPTAKKRYSFLSGWGGQRLNDLIYFKRRPAFSSWGGKRGPAFSSWGGKRSAPNMDDNGQINLTSVSKSKDAILPNPNDDPERDLDEPARKEPFSFLQSTHFSGLPEKGALLNRSNNFSHLPHTYASKILQKSVLPFLWNKNNAHKDSGHVNKEANKNDINDYGELLDLFLSVDNETPEENVDLSDIFTDKVDQLASSSFGNWENKRATAFNSWGGKRAPAFNSWGGKRAPAFNSWGGKRAPAFNSWGGKRAPAFNSWGGKRAPAFNSWGGKRAPAFNSWGGKRAPAFNSWGGKRAPAFNSWGGKRAPAFNSWGGKRAPAFNSWGGKRAPAFNSWGGKRAPAFNSWGGKRAPAFNSWGGKRAPAFNSWGGKRAPAFNSWGGKRNLIDTGDGIRRIISTGNGKRLPAFHSWGGKRSNTLTIPHETDNSDETIQDQDHFYNINADADDHSLNTNFENFLDNEIPHAKQAAEVENENSETDFQQYLNAQLIQRLNNEIGSTIRYKVKRDFPLNERSGKRNPVFFSWGGKRSDTIDSEVDEPGSARERPVNPMTLQDLKDSADERNAEHEESDEDRIHKQNLENFKSERLPRITDLLHADKEPIFSSGNGKNSNRIQNELQTDTGQVRVKRYITNESEQLTPPAFIAADDDYIIGDRINGISGADLYSAMMPVETTICCIKRPQYGDKNLFMQMLFRTKSFRDSSWPTIRPIRRGVDFYPWGGKRSSL